MTFSIGDIRRNMPKSAEEGIVEGNRRVSGIYQYRNISGRKYKHVD